MYTEAWHIHTACVHLSFTKTDQYYDTLRPQDFIDDFPLHLWLFLPRERRGEGGVNFPLQGTTGNIPSVEPQVTPSGRVSGDYFSAGGTHRPPMSQNLTSPLQPPAVTPNGDNHPMISFIAHVSDPIHAELERLQLLFLLRLKDSFTDLKMAMMKFLTLMSPGNETLEHVTSPTTPLSGSRHNTLVSGEECEIGESVRSEFGEEMGEERGEEEGVVRQRTLTDLSQDVVRNSTENSSDQIPNQKNGSASIGGCVIVRCMEADILLPTIFTEKAREMISGKNTPVNSPLSPSPIPLTTESPSLTPTRLMSPPRQTLPSPSPLTHTITHPPSSQLTPTTQPSGSQSSLLSLTSSTSQTSYQASPPRAPISTGGGLMRKTGLTGSRTSLPIICEGGQGSSVADDVISLRGDGYSAKETPHQHLQVPVGLSPT